MAYDQVVPRHRKGRLPLTLQAVEPREKVEQEDPGRSPGEEAKGPGQAQEKGETGHALQLLHQATAASCGAVGLHAADLDQNHHKDL